MAIVGKSVAVCFRYMAGKIRSAWIVPSPPKGERVRVRGLIGSRSATLTPTLSRQGRERGKIGFILPAMCFRYAVIRGLLAALCCLLPVASHSKPTDGILLESASTLNRGAWDMKFGVGYGSGAEPIEGPFLTATSKDPIDVDQIVVPLEIRYGLSDRGEIGWSAAFESDAGRKIPTTGNVTGTFLDAGGLQKVRLFGKWKIRPRLSWKVDFSFAGNNAVVDGSDDFDLGVKFIYGPRIGAGTLMLNLGIETKGGGGDFNNNGSTAAAEQYAKPFFFGIGYVYPFSTRLNGIFELAANTSPFEGGLGFKGNDLASALVGLRYGFTDRFFLTGGLGAGMLSGSPNLSVRLGLNWMMGTVRDFSKTEESDEFWAPSADLQEAVRQQAARDEARRRAAGSRTPQEAAENQPAGSPVVADDLSDRISQATEAFNRGDYFAAAAHYEAAINLKNDDPRLHYNLASTYFLMRRYFDARPYYLNAVRLNPADVDGHLYLGYTYFYLNNAGAAAREWRKVLDLDPTNALARQNLESMQAQ